MATMQNCKPCPETNHCGAANQTNHHVVHNITVDCNSSHDKKNQKHLFGHMFHRSSHNNEHGEGQATQKQHQQSDQQHGHQQQQKGHMLGQCFGAGVGRQNANHASGDHGTAHGALVCHEKKKSEHGAVISCPPAEKKKSEHGALISCPPAEKKKSEHGALISCPPAEKKKGTNHGCTSNGKGHTVIRTEKREEYVKCQVHNPAASADHCGNGQSLVSCVKKERVKVKMQVK